MFFVFSSLHGKSGYLEGSEIKVITNRFPNLPEFSKCFYSIDIISAGGVGPTRYKITTMCLMDNAVMENLLEQYDWEERKVDVNDIFYNQIEIPSSITWYYSREFSDKIMGGRFVGETYISIAGECIYIEAEE